MASFMKQPSRQTWMRLQSIPIYINLNRYYILRLALSVSLSHSPENSLSVRALHKQGVDANKCSDMYTFNPLFKHNQTHA